MPKPPRILVGILPERMGAPSASILFHFLQMAYQSGRGMQSGADVYDWIAQHVDNYLRDGWDKEELVKRTAQLFEYATMPIAGFADLPYRRTDLARNELVKMLLDSEFTHLLMLDADHQHPSDLPFHFARRVMDDPTKQVISALVFRRGQPYDPCHYIGDEEGIACTLAEWKPGMVKIDVTGAAALLVAREVFEAMEPPWFAFDYSHADKGVYPGEDTWFSRKCAEHGFDIWVDTTVTSPHLMEAWVTEETYRTYLKMRLADNAIGGQYVENSTDEKDGD